MRIGGVSILWQHFVLTAFLVVLSPLLKALFGQEVFRRRYVTISFLLFFILGAFRGEGVGNDTREYLRAFTSIAESTNITAHFQRFEIGYVVLNKLLSMLTPNGQSILFASSAFIMFAFARFILRYSKDVVLSTLLFYFVGYFGRSLNIIRLMMAIAILLFAYDFLVSRKFAPFVLCVILAALFHRTAIVFLIAFFLAKRNYEFRTVTGLFVVAIAAVIAFPTILGWLLKIFPVYGYYVGTGYLNNQIRLASIANFAVELLTMFFVWYAPTLLNSVNSHPRKSGIASPVEWSGTNYFLLLSVLLTLVSFRFNLLGRVSYYFGVFSLILVPNSLASINNKRLRVFLSISIVVFFFLYQTFIMIIRPDWNTIYPYSFFILGGVW